MSAKEKKTALFMLWGGFLAAVILWMLRLPWVLSALGMVLAHHGAQRLQFVSRWYWYASFAAIAGVLAVLLGVSLRQITDIALVCLGVVLAVCSLFGWQESRK